MLMGDSKHPNFREVQALVKTAAPDSGLLSKCWWKTRSFYTAFNWLINIITTFWVEKCDGKCKTTGRYISLNYETRKDELYRAGAYNASNSLTLQGFYSNWLGFSIDYQWDCFPISVCRATCMICMMQYEGNKKFTDLFQFDSLG